LGKKQQGRVKIRERLRLVTNDELGEQGWRSDESARLPPMWPSSICGLSLLLVVAFLRVPPSTKTNLSNSNSTRIEEPHENHVRLIWLPL